MNQSGKLCNISRDQSGGSGPGADRGRKGWVFPGRGKRAGLFLGAALLTLLAGAPGLLAQESILDSYQRNFIRASLSTKAGVLRDAATDERSAEFIGQLYEFALNFSLGNAEMLRDDPDMIAMTVFACRGAGVSGHKASVDTLWKIFLAYRDSLTRVAALEGLALLGKGNLQVAENLNQYLANQNNLHRSGMTPDYPTLSACISALAVLGDPSSFPVLFSAMIAGYPNSVTQETAQALGALQGDYRQFLIDVLRRNPPAEKAAAFRAGMNNDRFGNAEKGQIAEAALDVSLGLSPGSGEGDPVIAGLRYAAVSTLTQLQWTNASPLAVKHFYRVQADYQNGLVSRERLVEAINCLGAMGSSDAAQALALQLGFLNSQTERNGEFDDAITLAVVNALGTIGDKSAFDYLLYISYLSYPEHIQAAAREALTHLKW
jgi:HEAT repeat protein